MFRLSKAKSMKLVGALAILVIPALQYSFAQSSREVLDYMLVNRVGLVTASTALGLDSSDVAEELGYTGSFGFLEAHLDTSLMFADCWRLFTFLQGTAEDLGLTDSTISSYFELRAANDLSFVRKCRDDEFDSYLLLTVEVWTVGDTFPVAYHIEFTGQILPSYEGSPSNSVESAWLGYANAANVEGIVREVISSAVEDLAIRVLRVRRFLESN